MARPCTGRPCQHGQDRVRWIGDFVAFVVAETKNDALDALELIDVEYEVLPAVLTAEDALKPGAVAVS